MYVIRNTETGCYVAPSGSQSSYTNKLERARTFPTRDAAESERCPGNEIVVPVGDLMEKSSFIPCWKRFHEREKIIAELDAIVANADPETASLCELRQLEQQLEDVCRRRQEINAEVVAERQAFDAETAQYNALITTAETLAEQIACPTTSEEVRAALVPAFDAIMRRFA